MVHKKEMGTRADFYVGRGEQAEWLGSIALDGYPDGIPMSIRTARTKMKYRNSVEMFLRKCRHATFPKDGWPWPWEDSLTTDYSYSFEDGRVWASRFGSEWFETAGTEPEELKEGVAVFPNMKSKQRVTLGKRSGLTVFQTDEK